MANDHLHTHDGAREGDLTLMTSTQHHGASGNGHDTRTGGGGSGGRAAAIIGAAATIAAAVIGGAFAYQASTAKANGGPTTPPSTSGPSSPASPVTRSVVTKVVGTTPQYDSGRSTSTTLLYTYSLTFTGGSGSECRLASNVVQASNGSRIKTMSQTIPVPQTGVRSNWKYTFATPEPALGRWYVRIEVDCGQSARVSLQGRIVTPGGSTQ